MFATRLCFAPDSSTHGFTTTSAPFERRVSSASVRGYAYFADATTPCPSPPTASLASASASLLDRGFCHCVFLTKCTRPREHGCSGAVRRSRLRRSQPAFPEAEEGGALKARLHTGAAGRAFHAQGAPRVDLRADFVRRVFADDHNLGALDAGLKYSGCRPNCLFPAEEARTRPRAWPRARAP